MYNLNDFLKYLHQDILDEVEEQDDDVLISLIIECGEDNFGILLSELSEDVISFDDHTDIPKRIEKLLDDKDYSKLRVCIYINSNT